MQKWGCGESVLNTGVALTAEAYSANRKLEMRQVGDSNKTRREEEARNEASGRQQQDEEIE